MISKKVFGADGSNRRFLSDFIIRSEQFTRVYNYIFDVNGVDGDIDPSSGLYIRVSDVPASGDLVTIDKWDLVDNSISFYTAPATGSRVYIEVATTSEEFGDTITQPSVERAIEAAAAAELSAAEAEANTVITNADVVSTNADVVLTNADVVSTNADATQTALDVVSTNADVVLTHADVALTNADVVSTNADVVLTNADATSTSADTLETAADVMASNASATSSQLSAWEAEAEKMTADSYATELEDVVVKVYTSNGDGTFTATPTTEYSALHYKNKSATYDPSLKVDKAGDTMTGNLEAPSMSIGGNSVDALNYGIEQGTNYTKFPL